MCKAFRNNYYLSDHEHSYYVLSTLSGCKHHDSSKLYLEQGLIPLLIEFGMAHYEDEKFNPSLFAVFELILILSCSNEVVVVIEMLQHGLLELC